MPNFLQIIDVVKNFGKKKAVNQLNIQVEPGEIFGLIGGNGAGKTTTMRMVIGLFFPDEGRITYGSQSFSEEIKRRIGYLPEERGLYPKARICDQIVYLAQLRGMSTKQAEQQLRLWLERFQISNYYNQKLEELSKGNQQKIQFISAVIHNPDYLILDEVFSGLDPVNVEMMKAAILSLKEEGKTILFSSHRMDHVEELCRNLCILHQSNPISQGTLQGIKRTYPRDRVWLTTETTVQGVEQLPGVIHVERRENGLEIVITEEAAAQQILHLALQQTAVHRFEVKEPSLNDIFIKLVGGGISNE
jgi:ABC-2 type transport system ATP-binding protein